MSTLTSFEEITAWQKARLLSNKIYQLSREGDFSKDFKFRDQITSAAGSIMDNIAEGFERDGSREFIQFLAIAKGSAGEVMSQLYRALDQGYISQDTFGQLSRDALEVKKIISGLINYLRKSDIRGTKFKK